jgi:hypothetical protein
MRARNASAAFLKVGSSLQEDPKFFTIQWRPRRMHQSRLPDTNGNAWIRSL